MDFKEAKRITRSVSDICSWEYVQTGLTSEQRKAILSVLLTLEELEKENKKLKKRSNFINLFIKKEDL